MLNESLVHQKYEQSLKVTSHYIIAKRQHTIIDANITYNITDTPYLSTLLWGGAYRLSDVVTCDEGSRSAKLLNPTTSKNSNKVARTSVGLIFLSDWISFHSLATKYVLQMLTGLTTPPDPV